MARVLTTTYSPDTVQIKLTKIKDIDEKSKYNDKIEIPYEFTFTTEDKTVIVEKTTKALSAKNWEKKFYLKENSKGDLMTNYTWNASLLALMEIMRSKKDADVIKGDEEGSFDIDLLIGKKFDAVVVKAEGYEPFIDWVNTFKVNGVPVPNPTPKAEAMVTKPAVATSSDIDPDELPF